MGKGGYNGGSTVIHAGSGWVGRGSVTSQPAEKKKRPPAPSKPKRKKTSGKGKPTPSNKGHGLTIPEIITKAAQRVRTLENDLNKTRQRLAVLEVDHSKAVIDLETARSLPRKTALGVAIQEANKAKPAPTARTLNSHDN